MSVQHHSDNRPPATNGAEAAAQRDAESRYGNAFLLSDAPDQRLPERGMSATDAMRLLGEELVLTGSRAEPRDVRDDVDGA